MPNVARLIDMFCMHCRFRKSPEPFRREPMAGRLITLIFAISLLSVCPLTPAGAIPITVSFTAASFIELEEAVAAPMDPVTGSIVYDAASTMSNINSLTSINLTIAGHTYLLSEVGFISPAGSNQLIGGLSFGVGGILHHTDDFSIRWNQTTLIPFNFIYAATATGPAGGIFLSSTFSQFSVTAAAAVPEPSSLALLAAGVAALCVVLPFARRRSIDNPLAPA
jgi:PEP-CTERM motif